jgi:hypothetical protein
MANLTGGTLAPSQGPRQSAAARALGAPKGVTRPAKAGKIPGAGRSAQNAARADAKADYHEAHPSRAIGQRSVPAPTRSPSVFDPLHNTYSEPELERLGVDQAGDQQKMELSQYGRQAKEVLAQEGATQKAFQGYANTTNTLLGQQQQEAQTSAKTFENQQAESALQAGKAIETAGQNAASLTGGYLDPAVKAQLLSESQRAGTAGQAGTSFAANLGQNEMNYMGNLRAVAAQKATEGHAQIAGTYGKQLGTIRGRAAEATAKVVPNSLKFANEIGQKQFTDAVTRQGLGIKQETLGAKVQEGKAKLAVQERGQNLSRQSAAERNQITARGQSFNNWAKREDLAIKKLSAVDKARYDQARIQIDKQTKEGKAPNPAAGRKYLQTLNNALSTVKAELARGQKKGFKGQQLYNIARKQLGEGKYTGKGGIEPGTPMGQNLIDAALNLAVYGRLSTVNQAEAQALGLSPNMKPEWFRSK